MTVAELMETLKARAFSKPRGAPPEITRAIASDMMSDVLASRASGGLLLTGCANPQSVRTAEVCDIPVICYVQGKHPGADSIALAQEKDILLLATDYSLFDSCGCLFAAGVRGCSPRG